VIIVSFKSDHIIHRCISSIDKEIEIIVVDNSNDLKFKNNIEEQYKNVKCILSSKNVGMGAGNNLGIKNTDKEFALILNPDAILDKNTRIGNNVVIVNKDRIEEADRPDEGFYIRNGIVVVVKNATITDGTII